MSTHLKARFDPAVDKMYCSRCGRQCVESGHIMGMFFMCPAHGEFTMAPVVMREEDGWFIHFSDETERSMWETCRHIDSLTT